MSATYTIGKITLCYELWSARCFLRTFRRKGRYLNLVFPRKTASKIKMNKTKFSEKKTDKHRNYNNLKPRKI